MENVLLISSSAPLEKRIGELIESPERIERVSSWQPARQFLAKTTPAVVLIDSELAGPAAANQLVQLDDVLGKDDKQAYFVGNEGQPSQWTGMFDTFAGIVEDPEDPEDSSQLQNLLESSLQLDDDDETETDQADTVEEVVVRLAKIGDGSLDKMPLGRLLYNLRMREQTGVLQLVGNSMNRSFAFQAGRLVTAPHHDNEEALKSAYAWTDGNFQFQPRQSMSGSPVSTFTLMIEGLVTHRGQRQLMDGLMSRMQTYPVPTQLWDDRNDNLDWEILQRFIDLCDGGSNLETIFGQFGNQVTDAFRAAAFARDTDLVVFRGEQTAASIEVQYDHKVDASSGRTSLASHSSAAAASSAATDTTSSKAERAVGANRGELKRELKSFLQSIKSMSSHEVFGVWEGCGREVIKETYYRMVKEHHPDVYGGNTSGEIRRLAEEIFVKIRETYSELLKVEDEQTTPPPEGFDPSQLPRQRRNQRSTLHPGQAESPVSPPDDGEQSQQQQPGRKSKSSTPIGLGREPSTAHPEFQSQDSPRQQSRTGSALGGQASQARSSPSSEAEDTEKSDSKNKQSDPKKDEQWRRKRLKRLQRSSKKKRARTTSSTSTSRSSSRTASAPGSPAKPPEKRAQDAFNTAYKHYKNERFEKALPLFEKAHELNSGHGLYMTFLADTLFKLDNDNAERCIKLLHEAIETENRQALPDAHLFIANILKLKENEHRAYRHYKRALELNPGCRDAEREVRLYERRHGKDEKDKSKDSDKSGGFFKKLFKK